MDATSVYVRTLDTFVKGDPAVVFTNGTARKLREGERPTAHIHSVSPDGTFAYVHLTEPSVSMLVRG